MTMKSQTISTIKTIYICLAYTQKKSGTKMVPLGHRLIVRKTVPFVAPSK